MNESAPDDHIAVTPSQPGPEARIGDYSDLDRKIRRAQLRKDRMGRWASWGGRIAAVVCVVVVIGFWITVAVSPKDPKRPVEYAAFVFLLLFGTMVSGIVGGAFGALAAITIELYRPIVLAVVDSKKYEQEYGAVGPPPRPEKRSEPTDS